MSKELIQRLHNEAGECVTKARALLDEYGTKAMPQEKTNEYDTLMGEYDSKTAQAARLQRTLDAEAKVTATVNDLPAPVAGNGQQKTGEQAEIEMKAFRRLILVGPDRLTEAERKALDTKALQSDVDVEGGFWNSPGAVVNELLKAVDDAVFSRQLGRVFQLGSSESLGVPTLDTDLNDADWTAEVQQSNVDEAMRSGRRELKPHPLSKEVKISRTLLRRAAMNPESIVRDRLAYKFGVTEEKGFLTGGGSGQPLGLFTLSTDGVTSARDVTMSGATAFDADDLFDTKFSLKAQYQNSPTTRWIFHRDAIKRARLLKDANDQYLWAPGLGGQPSTLIDTPYVMSEFAPNTFTTGLYVGLIGDMKYYWIAECLRLEIQVLEELYARTNQKGFIGRMEVDGQPVLAEAFARMKLA